MARFEVLGCSAGSSAAANLSAAATSHGHLTVSWQPPRVQLGSGGPGLELDSRRYTVRLVRGGAGEVAEYNTTDSSVIHGGPVYGATYTAHLTCHHHGLPLRCGAARPKVLLSCPNLLYSVPGYLLCTESRGSLINDALVIQYLYIESDSRCALVTNKQ